MTPIASILSEVVRWLTTGSHWSGREGIIHRLAEHVEISVLAVVLAGVVALPIGLTVGHTRRGQFMAVSVGNVGRALPSFGILALVFPFTLRYAPGSIGFPPTLITLVLLAIPPILTNTSVAVQQVDPDTVEAARGMGLSGRQVLLRLELPLAAPIVVAGFRTAAVQVVATATLGAIFSFGGLGRFIVDGFATNDHARISGGAVLVAALAVLTEVTFALVERWVSPKTASGRRRRAVSVAPGAPTAEGW